MAGTSDRAAPPANRLAPISHAAGRDKRSFDKGDVPQALLDRYLVERDGKGRPERFYRDHKAKEPMFQDRGRSLIAERAHPDTVADMLKVARHRGWEQVRVGGTNEFRQEVWVQAKTLGLDVKGYRPTERDRSAASTPEREPEAGPVPRRPGAADGRAREYETEKSTARRIDLASLLIRASNLEAGSQARLLSRIRERGSALLGQSRTNDQDRLADGERRGSPGRDRESRI